MPPKKPKVLLVGGSIAGLAAFTALTRLGLDVHVFEERTELGGAGKSSGLALWSPGIRALRSIASDLADEVIAAGSVLENQSVRTPGGIVIQESRPDFLGRYGEPAVMIRWQSLHQLLEARVPPEKLHKGQSISSFSRSGRGDVEAVFAGANGEERWTGDVLVGADGIRSSVRQMLLGDEPPPRDGGRVVFRCVVPTSSLPAGISVPNSTVLTLAAGKTGAMMDTGGGTTYAAVGALDEGLASLSHIESNKDRCLAVLAEDGGWPLYTAIFSATDESGVRAERIIDRPPLDPARLAGAGPVTLLGDSLHPMVPSIGFGAVSAIEGALELAQCLDAAAAEAAETGEACSPSAIAAALRRYEGARLERATAVQLQSFTQGIGSYKQGGRDGGSAPVSGAGRTGSPDFQTWLQTYRSPWGSTEAAAVTVSAEKQGVAEPV